MATSKKILSELKKVGTAQNRKIYGNHGASGPMYGVSFANLNRLKKQIKCDHPMALELWKSGNLDARILALMIADPQHLTMKQAETWLIETQFFMVSNVLSGLVARTDFAEKAFKKWAKSPKEFYRHCGYDLLATMLKNGWQTEKESFAEILDVIEKKIHQSPNLHGIDKTRI